MNVVPWAGSLKDDGWSSEELKVRNESRKILGLRDLRVSATCVRVPVITTHSLAVHARFAREVDQVRAQEILRDAEGVVLRRRPGCRRVPDAERRRRHRPDVGGPRAAIGRRPQALDLFVCGDNLRKGAALNTAQIAEVVALSSNRLPSSRRSTLR